MSSRCSRSLLFVLAIGLVSLPVRVSAAESQPNVVLIVADDLGWADLSCYGSKFHRTPNLDRMATAGVRFTEAYSACPVCSPTRAALMTGKWPARLHLTDWLPGRVDRPDQKLARPGIQQQLPLQEETIAELLCDAGYVTGHIGKWHLGGQGFAPEQQGFALNVAGDFSGTPFSYFAPFRGRDRTGRDRFMPGLEQAPEGEYLTDRLAAEAEKFLEQNRDRPFFLYLPHYGVHTPLRAKQDVIAKYAADQKPTPGQQSNPIYAAMLESLDDAVGRVRQKLQELKLVDNTLLIFTSDNGGLATQEGPNTPATINSPLREGKGYLYEGGIRVPLIVELPTNSRTGAVTKTPVISQDLFSTILEFCRVANAKPTDGVSLLGVLKEDSPLKRDTLYWHYPHYSNQGGKPGGAVREGNLKLVEFYENERRELFNVAADPREAQNIAADRPEDVRRLAAKLAMWRTEVNAQAMRPNPDFVPNPQAADGTITLPARTAAVHGSQLRFEPLPHKNTLGFWTNVDDWASWEFTVTKPGVFELEAWQGCGTGQGGSKVEFASNGQNLSHSVVDTGHFQNFQPIILGTIRIDKTGRMEMTMRAKSKSQAAIMDLRQIILRPVQ